jgi:hypothetical protein
MPSKLHNERRHAKIRAAQRYGLTLNRHQYRAIVDKIRGAKAQFLGRESARLTHWAVEWEGRTLHAVYDSKRHAIVTFLPPGSEVRQVWDKAPEWFREVAACNSVTEG